MVERCRNELGRIRNAVVGREHAFEEELSLVHDVHRERARNLVHYLAFRECDGEELHEHLECLGLDPLADVEWDVLGRIDRVLQRLNEMSGSPGRHVDTPGSAGHCSRREFLRLRTDVLFGSPPPGRNARIMLTLPSEAADDAGVVRAFAAGGADCFRINCARDGRETWQRCIDHVRHEGAGGKQPLIFMDLGGSKLRVASCAEGRQSILLERGSTLFISRTNVPPSRLPGIAVNNPSVLDGVLPGHRVWFDDGKIGGIVAGIEPDALRMEITHAKEGGKKLRLDRGVNFPDSLLRMSALTQKDLDDLPFAAGHADFLALSFIRTPSDVDQFRTALLEVTDSPPAIVVKIETREALRHLPGLMLAGMRLDRVAVLLARGDLAVECGIEEMAHIQRNVLRYCAAASLPLFWASGVLERTSRTGEPTRAEITDAEESARAQCVMLNKGPKTMDALRLLGDLLTRSKEDT